MPLVARRREHLRPARRALRLKREEVQIPRLRRIAHVLHDDAEGVLRAAVDEVDRLDRILSSVLDVSAAGDDAAGALLHEVEVVVVARGAERIVPAQKNRHLAVLRQRDHVVGLRPEAEDVGRIGGTLKQMEAPRIGDAGDRRAIDAGARVRADVMLVRIVAAAREVRADRKVRVVQRSRRVARHAARPVVRLAEEADVVDDDVVRRGEKIDGLVEREIRVEVGERQLRARRDVVDDLQERRPFRAGALKRAGRRRGRQPLEIAVRLKRSADDPAGRAREDAPRVANAARGRQIAGRHRPAVHAEALRGASRREHALQAVGDDADAHAGAVEPELLADGIGMQDRVAFARHVAGAAAGVGRQPNRIDDGELRDGVQPRHRQARLHAPARLVADLDRHAGVGELLHRLVGHRGQQDVDLHVVVRVDAEAAAAHRILHRLRQGVGRQGRLAAAGARGGANEVGENRRELRALSAGVNREREREQANKKRSHRKEGPIMTSKL